MRVAIIGAGPAGSHLGYQLSKNGVEVLLFDAREAWEKPCGGGVTSKALREFDFLNSGDAPKQMVSSLRLITARERQITVAPREDFAIYSRKELSRMMRIRAIETGAQFYCARVGKTNYSNGKWRLETTEGDFTADFLVGADGANSIIRRRVGVRFGPQDFAYGLGWHVKTSENISRVEVKYIDEFSGYLWLFPRTDHISYGIAAGYQEATPERLKAKLLDFIAMKDRSLAEEINNSSSHSNPRACFYAAMIPALDVTTWDRLSVCKPAQAWALIGDAAGFVDPLTGEGIYYAIKSAALLAKAIMQRPSDFDEMWRKEFGAELRRAAQLQRRFYRGNFAGAPVTERMVQFANFHSGIRAVLRDLVAGDQGYLGLKLRLLRSLPNFI
jgi:geranylgeranyl reductase family protein